MLIDSHRILLRLLRSHHSLFRLYLLSGLDLYSFFLSLRELILLGLVFRIYISGRGYNYFLARKELGKNE